MRISEIIYCNEYILSEIDENIEFDSLSTDASTVSEHDILVIPNSNRLPDITQINAMPLAVICDTNVILPKSIPTIRVKNSRIATANAFYRYNRITLDGIKLIGVTGTNGKTTTATIIQNILSGAGYSVGFIGTGKIEINGEKISDINYSMTTPDPPLLYKSIADMIRQKCNAIVMEVSSHALALDKVAPLKFDYGIFTNLSPEHIDFHGDMESYFKAKMKLFDNCNCGIFNIDDEYCRKAYSLCDRRKISAGILWRGNVWASNIVNRGFDGIEYIYHSTGFSFRMKLPFAGIYNSYNSMLAAAVSIDMGCKPCEVKQIISETSPVLGRYEIIKDEISVIIDYAHTSAAFEAILHELSSLKQDKRLTVVFGCGGNRDKTKRPKMAGIAEKYADRIILTSDNSRNEDTKEIIADIIKGFDKGCYEIKETRADAIQSAILEAKTGDIVAIIGKGPERYNIDKDGYHYFNEKKQVLSALKDRREG